MTHHQHFEGTIEITGSGTVSVAPDEANIQLSVITEGKTAAEATARNADRADAVVKAVSDQPNHGVTTSGLGVQPIMRYDQETGTTEITGYRASNTVSVKTKPGYAGQSYDAGVKAGANESSGISFRVQNEQPHRDEALRIAVKNAFAEAGVVAETANMKLEGPETITIDPTGGSVFYRAEAVRVGAPETPVIPGDIAISASVRIIFRARR